MWATGIGWLSHHIEIESKAPTQFFVKVDLFIQKQTTFYNVGYRQQQYKLMRLSSASPF
jgi:hypothetical protein